MLHRRVIPRECAINDFHRRLDAKRSAVRHRVTRVHREIREDLIELPAVHSDRGTTGCELYRETHIFSNQAAEHLRRFGNRIIYAEDRRLHELTPGEREQLPREDDGAFGGASNFLEKVDVLLVGRVIGDHQLGFGDDDGEQVVEIVSHAAGEPAHSLHLLRLCQAFLGFAQLRDVCSNPHDAPDDSSGVANRVGASADPADRAVGSHNPEHLIRWLSHQCVPEHLANRHAIILMHPVDPVLFRGTRGHGTSPDFRTIRADVQWRARRNVRDEERLLDVVGHLAKPLFTFAQRLLRFALLRYVAIVCNNSSHVGVVEKIRLVAGEPSP